jgi:hypothetical protein
MMQLRQDPIPVQDGFETATAVLMRLSYELHALAASTESFHDLAFAGDVARSLDDAAFVQATQDIDLTQQVLSNLSQYVECLALAASKDWLLDTEPASSLVTLSDLRDRLSGKSAQAPAEPPEDDIWF